MGVTLLWLFHSGRPAALVNKGRAYHNRGMIQRSILACLSCLALTACGSTDSPPPATASSPHGLTEAHLRAAIGTYIADQKGPTHSQYEYSIADLNGDGRRDALVMFNLPYGYWCGWGGCTMAVFDGSGDSFALMSEIRNVRGPVIVTQHGTNGWKDIAVRVSGTRMSDKTVVLQHENGTYPENPAGLTDIAQAMIDIPGQRLFP